MLQTSHSTLNDIEDSFSRQSSYRYYRQNQEDPIYQNQEQVCHFSFHIFNISYICYINNQ